ncbi:hypothetical protein HQ587_04825 [bacterium]|nr:hypothetical protein [bacterium]
MNAQTIGLKTREHAELLSEFKKRCYAYFDDMSSMSEDEFLSCLEEIAGKVHRLEAELRGVFIENPSVVIADPEIKKHFIEIIEHPISGGVRELLLARMTDSDTSDDLDFAALLQMSYMYPPKEYFESKLDFRGIVFKRKIPEMLRHFILETIEAYALGLHNSLTTLCRTILEVSVFDCASRQGLIKQNWYKAKHPECLDYVPRKVIPLATDGNKPLHDRVRKSYNRLSKVVHGQALSSGSMKQELIDTIKIVELIYEHNFK